MSVCMYIYTYPYMYVYVYIYSVRANLANKKGAWDPNIAM